MTCRCCRGAVNCGPLGGRMTSAESVDNLAAVPADWMIAARPGCPAGTVGELIAAQAAAQPDTVAVRQWDSELTYAELLAAARRLADSLRAHGVGSETRVG